MRNLMTVVVTAKRILCVAIIIFALIGWALHVYTTYKTDRYLNEPIGKNTEGVELSRAQLLDQLIVERFVKPTEPAK